MKDPENEEPVIAVEVMHGDRAARLVVRGDLDLDGAKVLDRIVDEQTSAVELDLSGVEFLDSSGLRSLLVHRLERSARVVAASTAVSRVLELAAVTFLLEDAEIAPA